jgi:hypothetical protein
VGGCGPAAGQARALNLGRVLGLHDEGRESSRLKANNSGYVGGDYSRAEFIVRHFPAVNISYSSRLTFPVALSSLQWIACFGA